MAKVETIKTFLVQVPIKGWVEVEMNETVVYSNRCAKRLAEKKLSEIIRDGLYLGVEDGGEGYVIGER